ncbi:serine/threonine-protein kinase [Botrimarina hoheduenensis]|uniref:Serine/threonine-protein kinase PrkC n=1 Tax=Botrimarina hoheduenensis TaxID=2528000 RepID=A0A5C5VUX5_9BACT|nr:serine/threonine-protein kinase [Botrimarina hoheduenensis]TWT41411.1 Serine/threonine-protein kinase PrkC [Botrimarina hoheduenensis]
MSAVDRSAVIRSGTRLGKYRIEGKLGQGAFATVYRAMDTLEGMRVALKIPNGSVVESESKDDFLREVRLAARLRHPRILPLKSADYIDDRLVLTYPLGDKTLDDRLHTRLTFATALEYFGQMLEAIAAAHEQKVIHCDIKPDNLILIDDEIYLADFGIAKIALRTIKASGSGTVGYCAPEQAMGKPSFRSDVFSAGLVGYRLFAGKLPEWPFDWPPAGFDRLKQRAHPDLVEVLRRSIALNPRQRYATAAPMLAAFLRAKPHAARDSGARSLTRTKSTTQRHWKTVQWRQFQRLFGKQLATRCQCSECSGPVAESMKYCPWCAAERSKHVGESRTDECCPRCERGLKPDWPYCPWCYGPGFEVHTDRSYSDVAYTAKCANKNCQDRRLMAFMRYCPWCHRKVKRKWKIEGSDETCTGCGWGVVGEFWSCCPWCGKAINQ